MTDPVDKQLLQLAEQPRNVQYRRVKWKKRPHRAGDARSIATAVGLFALTAALGTASLANLFFLLMRVRDNGTDYPTFSEDLICFLVFGVITTVLGMLGWSYLPARYVRADEDRSHR